MFAIFYFYVNLCYLVYTMKFGSVLKVFGDEAYNCDIVSRHLLVVPKDIAKSTSPKAILDRGFKHFRHTNSGQVVFSNVLPDKLEQDDFEFLSQKCDGGKKYPNKRVKRIIADAAQAGAGEESLHLFDVGCGEKPIVSDLKGCVDLAFTGVDVVHTKMHIPRNSHIHVTNEGNMTQDWDDDLSVEKGHKPVVTSVYSLHFMDKAAFVDKLENTISSDGIFVGNLFLMGSEKDRKKQVEDMKVAFENSCLNYTYIPDGKFNAFFVAGDESLSLIHI